MTHYAPSDHYGVRGRAFGGSWHADLPWVARQALPNVPLTQNDPKHTDTRHPLPDFSCKIPANLPYQLRRGLLRLAMGTTQHDTRLLTRHGLGALERGPCSPYRYACPGGVSYGRCAGPWGMPQVTENR